MKPWYKSKTIWLGVVTVLSAAATAIVDGASVKAVLVAVLGAANIYLRTVTADPVGKR